MIIIKVINQKLVQVALANSNSSNQLASAILATKNRKQLFNIARTLVQSTSQNQKVTNANNQQLIPIARNISFRQCHKFDNTNVQDSRSKVSFSIAASNTSSPFIATDLNEPAIFDQEERRSPFEELKQRARDVVEKRESVAKIKYYGQSFNETLTTSSERRLVVLMSWLEAKEKHIEKYRQFYLDRGFDVLNVKTSPFDILLPGIGAKKISEDFVRFMSEKQYSDVLLHGFSVGGYMFGSLLLEIDTLADQQRKKLLDSIRGIVFDSLVPFEGTCIGVSRSITPNLYLAKAIEMLLRMYLYFGHSIATKHYLRSSEKVWGGPLRCPTLFLISKDDVISDYRIVEKLEKVWTGFGIECHKMMVDSCPHVQIFTRHQEAYVNKVEDFLRRIKMN